MALQSSGAISISQINAEVTATDSNSLATLSQAVGWGSPHAMSEFYGYSSYTPPTCYYFYASYDGYFDYYDCSGNWSTQYFSYGGGVCAQSAVSGGLYNSGNTCLV